MGTLIKVDPAKLEAAAAEITNQAGDYQRAYEQLYAEVENLATHWQGKDNLAFTNQIDGFKDDFLKMKQLMIDYADYLKVTAKNYQDTQDDRVAQAQRLTN